DGRRHRLGGDGQPMSLPGLRRLAAQRERNAEQDEPASSSADHRAASRDLSWTAPSARDAEMGRKASRRRKVDAWSSRTRVPVKRISAASPTARTGVG
ncbi:hypothetical protein LTR94_035507, partial [Friedmanniomyces endolithicus]